MTENKWREDENEELSEAASIFEELNNAPQNEEIGDILYVEGIEDDEAVIDEDVVPEADTTTTAPPPAKRSSAARSPLPTSKTIAEMYDTADTQTNEGEMTIGEFFLPLVRQAPPAKIHAEQNSIGSFFEKYTRRDEA